MRIFESRAVTLTIERPPEDVYRFASRPENLPLWASGLGGSIENVNGQWVAEAPFGRVMIEMAAANDHGVLDHIVTVSTGERFLNPMRVVANGDGSEVIFILYRQPGMTAEKFDEDTHWVAKDLGRLKELLEG